MAAPRPPDPSDPANGPTPLAPSARTEDQVRRAQRLESLGRLAGGVAHDFNNILGVILGYVELARMGMVDVDPKVHRHLDMALSTLGRARQLADRLLDFARETPRAPDVYDVNEAAQQVRELLTETLDRRIELDVDLGAGLAPSPLGRDELRQVITNLCLNAVEAMPGGGRLTLQTSRHDVPVGGALRPGTYVLLRVVDTGPGIPRELRERIFEPWFTTRPESSSGMGLWVAQGLVERFGGRIHAGGDEHGAVFSVWFPSALDVRRDARPAPAGRRATDGRPVDVLIVDDEPGVRDITRAFLESEGYSVLEAGTGAEAEQLLDERPGGVRVVFLDHLLPDVHGADLAWKIDALVAGPLIVMATGAAGSSELDGLPAAARVLRKPYLRDDVTRLLRQDLQILPR